MNNNGKKRILVVDDDFNITELTQIILETAGYECQTTNSGKECVKLLGDKNDRFDLILLDVAMPGFSGLDVVKTVKEQKLFPLKRIVLFTASSAPFLEDKEIKRYWRSRLLQETIQETRLAKRSAEICN